MNNRDVEQAFEEGDRIDRAMNRSFAEAVRLHRAPHVPLVLWRDGKVCYVDPWKIPLPHDDVPTPGAPPQ